VVVRRNNTQHPGCLGWRAVTSRLLLHQDVLDVVLDDSIWLIWLAEESSSGLHFVLRVGDLVPDYGSEVYETDPSAALLDACVQRNHRVVAVVGLP
jgi:hypothetical protein